MGQTFSDIDFDRSEEPKIAQPLQVSHKASTALLRPIVIHETSDPSKTQKFFGNSTRTCLLLKEHQIRISHIPRI